MPATDDQHQLFGLLSLSSRLLVLFFLLNLLSSVLLFELLYFLGQLSFTLGHRMNWLNP